MLQKREKFSLFKSRAIPLRIDFTGDRDQGNVREGDYDNTGIVGSRGWGWMRLMQMMRMSGFGRG